MKLSVVDQSPIASGQTAADALHNTIELAQLCERLGYERYWVAEHHSAGSFAGTAPDVLIARLGAETKSIRLGSGAVLLPHYSPLRVAEAFRMLHALYPNRIDLGIGRAPGGTPLETYALQRAQEGTRDDFPEKLVEMLAFFNKGFPEQHPFNRILVQPEMPGGPEVWLLGSSNWSADAASQLGLPYAFAHFINPEPTRRAIEFYRKNFKPSAYLSEPKVLLATGAVAADTEAEAERLYTSYRMRRIMRDRGDRGPIPSPEESEEQLKQYENYESRQDNRDNGEWPRVFHGSIERVHEEMDAMLRAVDVDELMVVTVVHSHRARLHSHELLANAFGITPRVEEAAVS
ncbi:MAG: LLM class flavin-dependent oxidoreductase [Dehalococcoidia bacterium]